MEKKQYLKPEMRTRPVFTKGTLLYEASFGKGDGSMTDGPYAKEGSDLNYHPEFKDVWAD